MDRLKQIESFVAVATKGSLTAAANAEGVAPAVIGRRIDALEERLGVKLDNRRLCVASPIYLKRAGAPKHPSELLRHECLTLSSDASQTRGWAFTVDGELTHWRPHGRIDCSDGQVLHDWCVQGLGIAWRSTWEVETDIARGQLVTVLDEYAAPSNGIYAVVAQRKHLPLRVRLWIDFLKHTYGDDRYWHPAATNA